MDVIYVYLVSKATKNQKRYDFHSILPVSRHVFAEADVPGPAREMIMGALRRTRSKSIIEKNLQHELLEWSEEWWKGHPSFIENDHLVKLHWQMISTLT